MAQRITTRLRQLQGKLALAYTVTTASVLAVFLLLLASALLNDYLNPRQQERLITETMASLAQQAAPLLEREPIDTARLSVLLAVALERSGLSVFEGPGPEDADTESASLDLGQGSYFVAVSPDGTMIASTRLDHGGVQGQPIAALRIPGLSGEQLRGLLGSTQLRRLAEGEIVASAPVTGGRSLGTLLYVNSERPAAGVLLLTTAQGFGSTIAVGAGVAAMVGLAFGLTVAGGLTRRLRTIEQVSATWGRGNFAPRLADRSPDEIGQLSRQLNGVAEQLQHLVQERQQFAALEERNRLARDLHDSVKQHVFAVSMNLAAAEELWRTDPAAAAALAANAAATAGTAQRELTAIIHALRPVELERVGLAQALRDMVFHWTSRRSIVVTSQLEPIVGLAPEHGEVLFRIAQEALANAVRHSGATHVRLELRREASAALLRISDNGRGFAEASARQGLGLQSMRERAAGVGARLTISSGDTGTMVEVILRITMSQEEPPRP